MDESLACEEGGPLTLRRAPTSDTMAVITWQVLEVARRPKTKAQPVARKSHDGKPNFRKFLPMSSTSSG